MSEEKKESRINLEDLPRDERELSTEEAKKIEGGSQKIEAAGNFGDTQGLGGGDMMQKM
jgi:hypothetical protein